MTRDATVTRARLLRAGEQRFARDGVTGAKLSDVVRDAGQANDSAVGYHFGSRQGLLDAIVGKHVSAMDERRVLPTREEGLRALVDAIVAPTAALLSDEDGRDFLRITEQLADWSGVGSGRPGGTPPRHRHRDPARGPDAQAGRPHRDAAGPGAGRADGHVPDRRPGRAGTFGRVGPASADGARPVRRAPGRRTHRRPHGSVEPSHRRMIGRSGERRSTSVKPALSKVDA